LRREDRSRSRGNLSLWAACALFLGWLALDGAVAHGTPRTVPQNTTFPAAGPVSAEVESDEAAIDDDGNRARREAAARARAAAEASREAERQRLAEYELALDAAESSLDRAPGRRTADEEAVLGLRQQALEARVSPVTADRVYDELRAELRSTRRQLSDALTALDGGEQFPTPPIPVAQPPEGVSTGSAKAREHSLRLRRDQLLQRTRDEQRTDARLLLERLTLLNEARLELLPYLSPQKRQLVTGLSLSAWDQVAAELGHLALIVRYHAVVRVHTLRAGVSSSDVLPLVTRLVGLLFLSAIAVVGFLLWRANMRRLIPAWEQNVRDNNLAALRASPDFRLWLLQLVSSLRSPLEWIALALVLRWLLPDDIRALPEVQIAGLVIAAFLIAALAARVLDFTFGGGSAQWVRKARELGPLRLKSMRLVANVVVTLALALTVTARLVGQGAVYRWVEALGWLVATVVAVTLVYRWRHVTYDRIERQRRPGPLSKWMLANRSGRMAPAALLVGTVVVVGRALTRRAKSVGGRFAAVRRGFAYLFRQELSRTDRRAVSDLVGLGPPLAEALSPDVHGDVWITPPLQGALDQLIRKPGPGLVALVGERGSGKSTALKYLHRRLGKAKLCQAVDLVGSDQGVDQEDEHIAMLLDGVDELVHFDVGGLADLDACLERARKTAHRDLWVLSFDSAVWPLICRLRDPTTLFASVIHVPRWSDTAISEILTARSQQAGIRPRYERLVDHASELDDIDLLEAVEAKTAAFTLLLWDASRGNPGVALHLWRSVLGTDAEGQTFVRPFQPVSELAIERLPLDALFVYRAVLRQPGAPLEQLVAATRLPPTTVTDVLRVAIGRGHIEPAGAGHRVSWSWFRAVTRGLNRRHLEADS
jgi:hypothetical protein